MVAEISRRKTGEKCIVADFFITNFRLWLLKFQEEKTGEKCIVADFFITNFSSMVAEILRRKNVLLLMF